MSPSKTIVVCADDYALTPGVSRAIRELVASRRISATSAMTVSEFWAEEAPQLAAVAGDADIGLHLTLTEQAPLGPMPRLAPQGRLPGVATLIRKSLARTLPLDEIEAEIERQLAAFVTVWGRPPAHVDGHHHTHQLPGIRGRLLRVLTRHFATAPQRPYLRNCHEPVARILKRGITPAKAAIISALATGFAHAARRSGFATNDGFSGAYDLTAPNANLPDLFASFVEPSGPRPLVMCHPGYVDATLHGRDSMTTPRADELAFLGGAQWPAILEQRGLSIGPFAKLG